jgi:uncharacterized DUF497 family protein
MKIVYDPAKDVSNQIKHGISLALVAQIEWDTLRDKLDTRHAYGELRVIGFALIGSRLYCVVFTDRDEARRIISLRKANPREVKYYVSEN